MSLQTPDNQTVTIVKITRRRGTFLSPTFEDLYFSGSDMPVHIPDSPGPDIVTVPDPSIVVSMARHDFLSEDTLMDLSISTQWDFVRDATVGRASRKLQCEVWRYHFQAEDGYQDSATLVLEDLQAEKEYVYVGPIVSAVKNPGGQSGIATLKIGGPKSGLRTSPGIIAVGQCERTFANGQCQYPLATTAAQITNIDRYTWTITGLTVPDKVDRWWKFGFVYLDGYQISIRDWDKRTDPTLFLMGSLPPLDWESLLPLDVEIFPGCVKSVAACRQRDQLDNFLGVGIGIPARHPILER